jgi:hypothetical protein
MCKYSDFLFTHHHVYDIARTAHCSLWNWLRAHIAPTIQLSKNVKAASRNCRVAHASYHTLSHRLAHTTALEEGEGRQQELALCRHITLRV